MYDNTSHWEECIICKTKQNETKHTLKTTWSLGYESCNFNNSYTITCLCGYCKKGKKPCVWKGAIRSNAGWEHYRLCASCNNPVTGTYYMNAYGSGKLYDANYESSNKVNEKCYKADGTKITCNNLGTCIVCKTTYTTKQHSLIGSDNVLYCDKCNEKFGTYTVNIETTETAPTTYTFTTNMTLSNAKFNSLGFFRNVNSPFSTCTQTLANNSNNGTQITVKNIGTFKSSVKDKYEGYSLIYLTINNIKCQCIISGIFYPDLIKPTISNIDIEDGTLNEWGRRKTITIAGTENYTNTVDIKILDDNDKVIYNGAANNDWSSWTTSTPYGKYLISCTLELEAGVEGRTFKVIVTDTCENSTQQEFTISKIDGIAPEPTSNNTITGEWTRERNFTFTATDKGIGNVQIAFNDVNDYQLATKDGENYSREYKFVGDSYKETKARVFFKDELGNVKSQEVTIDKIDNTPPTITNAQISNDKLKVNANDRHQTLGEGSGVSKYRFITSTEKLQNPNFTEENSTEVLANENITIPEIYKVKYVYIIAEDAVRKYKQ